MPVVFCLDFIFTNISFYLLSFAAVYKMDEEALQDVSTYYININKNDEPICSWHKSTMVVRSEKGLHFYELTKNPGCLDKKINFMQTFLPPVKFKASSSLFTDKVINNSMSNLNYTEMIHDQALWPHNPQLMEEMTCVLAYEWSPGGLLDDGESILAVLNNIGSVNLFVNINSKWTHIIEVAGSFSDNYRKTLRQPKEFAELKEAAHILSSSAMCWAPTAEKKSIYMATAQKNNSIMFWLINYNMKCTVQFHGAIECGEGEIITMKWIQISNDSFILICSNILGQIIILNCEIKNSIATINKPTTIWPDKDRMISTQLQHIKINGKIILFCNKHRHLLILMIDKNYNVSRKYISNINDYRISCITNSQDEIYLTTVNGKIYKINVSINVDNLEVSLHPIKCNLSPTCELYSIGFSQNSVICTLVAIDRKVNFRKEPLKINILIATTLRKLESLETLLLQNPTGTFTSYWDVVELLRYKCMKFKEVPSVVYFKLYEEACQNIYLLKLYLIFVTLYTNLKKLFKIYPIDNVPEESLDTIKEEILVIHAETLFRKLNEKRNSEGHLDNLEKEFLHGSINFLEYYCKKNNRELSDIINMDTSHLSDLVCKYTCQGCDELIQGFTCKNNHLNMFCSLTFTPIESFEYLMCLLCNRTVRIELVPQNPLCLICDVRLVAI